MLRIEDTDRERYDESAIEQIVASLNWLSITPDNFDNPMVQSERKDIYLKHALELVEKGSAYVCECSKDRLEKLREEQEKKKLPPQYDRQCRDLDLKYKEGCVIRLKMPHSGIIEVNDLVKGRIDFDAALIDDPVILKSDGFPTYHLAAVVDDHEMEISHVIRAEEWLSSTPKHIELYKAFGWEPPLFAHLPLILGSDRKKLSKRHGATSTLEYKEAGYLPDALVNFLVLLGWNPKDNREEFTREQLIREFSLENINTSPAVFDVDKLNSINEKYIRDQDPGRLAVELAGFGLPCPTEGEIALAQRGGYKTLREIVDTIEKLRSEPRYDADLLVFKKSTKVKTLAGLKEARVKLAATDIWSNEELQNLLLGVVSDLNLTNGDVFWPVRVALSGEEKSPSPVELLIALGKSESLQRIDRALQMLES